MLRPIAVIHKNNVHDKNFNAPRKSEIRQITPHEGEISGSWKEHVDNANYIDKYLKSGLYCYPTWCSSIVNQVAKGFYKLAY